MLVRTPFVIAALLCTTLVSAAVAGDDASTSVTEAEWFAAGQHFEDLSTWCQQWQGERALYMFDMYSASSKVSNTFLGRGYRAESFDIKKSQAQDILTRTGFILALDLAMQYFVDL